MATHNNCFSSVFFQDIWCVEALHLKSTPQRTQGLNSPLQPLSRVARFAGLAKEAISESERMLAMSSKEIQVRILWKRDINILIPTTTST